MVFSSHYSLTVEVWTHSRVQVKYSQSDIVKPAEKSNHLVITVPLGTSVNNSSRPNNSIIKFLFSYYSSNCQSIPFNLPFTTTTANFSFHSSPAIIEIARLVLPCLRISIFEKQNRPLFANSPWRLPLFKRPTQPAHSCDFLSRRMPTDGRRHSRSVARWSIKEFNNRDNSDVNRHDRHGRATNRLSVGVEILAGN